MKTAIVHDWLTGMRGGERVLETVLEMFPAADIFTIYHHKGSVSQKIENHPIHSSFMQKFPFMQRHYRHYLPFFPAAIESFDLRGYNLVISLSHCVAHGIIPDPSAIHVCYCFTPMRYAWDRFHDYFGENRSNRVKRIFLSWMMQRMRMWDVVASSRVNSYITISDYIARKIHAYYGKTATVVYPPVDDQFFQDPGEPEDFFLIVSALAPYKNIELAIECFNRSGSRLVIIGDGPEKSRLQKMALANVSFLGRQPDSVLRDYYRKCRAFIFPGEEDFGITLLEAQAGGKPVIALDRGGAKEAVIPGETGVLFSEPTPDSLKKVIDDFDSFTYSNEIIRKHAEKFRKEIFIEQMNQKISIILEDSQG